MSTVIAAAEPKPLISHKDRELDILARCVREPSFLAKLHGIGIDEQSFDLPAAAFLFEVAVKYLKKNGTLSLEKLEAEVAGIRRREEFGRYRLVLKPEEYASMDHALVVMRSEPTMTAAEAQEYIEYRTRELARSHEHADAAKTHLLDVTARGVSEDMVKQALKWFDPLAPASLNVLSALFDWGEHNMKIQRAKDIAAEYLAGNPVLAEIGLDKAWKDAQRCCYKLFHLLRDAEKSSHGALVNPLPGEEAEELGAAVGSSLPVIRPSDFAEELSKTPLGKLNEVFARVAAGGLPMELSLPKALVLAGAVAAQPTVKYEDYLAVRHGRTPKGWDTVAFLASKEDRLNTSLCDWHDQDEARKNLPTGANNAKFRIRSTNTMTTNIWALTVAQSGSGKDLGNLVTRAAHRLGLSLGGGSAEALFDSFSMTPSGIVETSDMQHYFDPMRWESSLKGKILNIFNAYSFREKTLKYNRYAIYAAPGWLGNVQQDLLNKVGTEDLATNGLLPRFLVSVFDAGRSRTLNPMILHGDVEEALVKLLQPYVLMSGEIVAEEPDSPNIAHPNGDVEIRYLQDVREIVGKDCTPETRPFGNRLVNEYAPRIACLIQADSAPIRQETWNLTRKIVLWFLRMAEQVTALIRNDKAVFENEKLFARVVDVVRQRQKDKHGIYRGARYGLIDQAIGPSARWKPNQVCEYLVRRGTLQEYPGRQEGSKKYVTSDISILE